MDAQKKPITATEIEYTEKAKNTDDSEFSEEASLFKTKRERWESDWKAEFKRDWEQSWKREWKEEWKKHSEKRQHHKKALNLKINDKNYELSLGKLIFGLIVLMVVPFKDLLILGGLVALYYYNRPAEESEEKAKPKNDEVTAA